MSKLRTAITVFEDDTALTLVKPYSDEYKNMLFVIYEDAYGEATGILTKIDDLREKLGLPTEEFDAIIQQLG